MIAFSFGGRAKDSAKRLAEQLLRLGVEVTTAPLDRVCEEADVLVTALSAHAPIVPTGRIRAGTHIVAVGTDTLGKQELDPIVFTRARVFTDDVTQALTIGESQHATTVGIDLGSTIETLGNVMTGVSAGRVSNEDVTLYDSTGLALQDLVVARHVLAATSEP